MKIEKICLLIGLVLIGCMDSFQAYEVSTEKCKEELNEDVKDAIAQFFTEIREGGRPVIEGNSQRVRKSSKFNHPK